MDGVDDLAAVNAFEVDARDAEICMAQLAPDDHQRDALASRLDGTRAPNGGWRPLSTPGSLPNRH
jgi:hypothetical protein